MSAYHVGPWVGEFGWLCLWQAYVRARVVGKHVVHYGASWAAPLFADIDIEFCEHPFTAGVGNGLSASQLGRPDDVTPAHRRGWLVEQARGNSIIFPEPS